MNSSNIPLIRKSFKAYFNEQGIELPQQIPVGQVNTFDDVGSGWTINYRLDELNGNLQLDFYAYHRMTNSRHERILESGEVISLENFWEFGFRIYEDDPERTEREKNEIHDKNKVVEEILRQKGLY